jgi:hypothetical protein
MKRAALAYVALIAAWPATAQVVTIPVQSLWQGLSSGVALTTTVGIYGYTSKSKIPHVLQTVKLGSISPLQSEFRAEFPGLRSAEMTVMQLKVKSTAEGSTFHTDFQTITPTKPLAINVPAGKKLWVVYKAPVGQQGELRFYVGSPPPAPTTADAGAALHDTRIDQVGQSFMDSAGNKWSLASPDPTVEGGLQPVVLRNGAVFGSALELVWQNKLVYARNTGDVWYSIDPLATSMSGWTQTSAPV